MDAAEDQQMVVCRQMMESLDGRPEPLVLVQEPENADQHCVSWQRGEHRQGLARGTRANGIGLGIAEKGQGVVEDVANAVEISGVEQIAVVMNDRADLLRLLDPAEMAGQAAGQQTVTAITRVNPPGGTPLKAQQRLCEGRGIEARWAQ